MILYHFVVIFPGPGFARQCCEPRPIDCQADNVSPSRSVFVFPGIFSYQFGAWRPISCSLFRHLVIQGGNEEFFYRFIKSSVWRRYLQMNRIKYNFVSFSNKNYFQKYILEKTVSLTIHSENGIWIKCESSLPNVAICFCSQSQHQLGSNIQVNQIHSNINES